MPVVHLRYRPESIPESVIKNLLKVLPKIIANELDVRKNKSARLKADDIEISVFPAQPLDINIKSLEIMIWAHGYPERLKNIEERKDKIAARVRSFLLDYDVIIGGWVWILLPPTAFGRI